MKETSRKEVTSDKVIIQVPKNLGALLQEKAYFGKVKDEFFISSVRLAVDRELNALGIDEMRRLESKYGLGVLESETGVVTSIEQKAIHKTPGQIEYEAVTLKIPTKLMNWLRGLEKSTGETAEEQLDYQLIDSFRASIEATTGQDLIEVLGLGPIFHELLKDERFKDC